jgi:hypothetical protein
LPEGGGAVVRVLGRERREREYPAGEVCPVHRVVERNEMMEEWMMGRG